MTKSNKTLLCCLLTCVMVLACALTLLPIAEPITANAAVDDEYELVTDVANLSVGDTIIIVNTDAKVALGTTQNSNNRAKSDTMIFENNKTKLVSNAQEIALENGLNEGTFALKVGDSYLYAAGSKSSGNNLNVKNSIDEKSTWTISIDSSSNAKIVTIATNIKATTLQYNPSANVFSCYAGTQNDVQIFKKIEKSTCEHDYGTEIAQENATCTVDGMKAHYKCSKCNKLFVLEGETYREVSETALVIKAAHTWSDTYTITTAATCTTDGVKTFTCTREGCGETKTETIPALGHNYGTDGKCTLCGAEKPAERKFVRVTNLEKLASGDKIIIARNGGNNAIAGNITESVMTAIKGATFSTKDTIAESISVGNLDIVVLTLTKNDTTWTFTNESGQKLGATAVKKLAWNNGMTEWTISFDENGYATIQNATSDYGRFLYNVNSQRFTTYISEANSSMLLPEIYKLEEPEAAKQFTVTETVTAVENGSILNNGTMYILPNGQIDVVYNVTANSGINALEGTIAWNAELFDFVSMTAGNIFGENNVTVSGESATTKKIAVTIGASNNATGVLLTVRYQLKAGVTAEQLANAKFGFTADVLFGTDTTTKVANTATENTVPMSVRQDATLTVNGVDYTADDRTITLTYNGQDITAGTEEGSVLKIATNHTGYNADCLTWTVVKNAGNYELKIAIAADGAYNAISEVTYTIVVKQVEIASTNIAITNNTTSKDLLGGNAKWTEADFTITYNGETLPDKFSGLYQIAIVNGEVAKATAEHTLTVELTLTAQASVNYVLTGTDVAEGKLSKQFVVSIVNAAINIIGMPDNVERAYNAQAIDLSGVSVEEGATLKFYVALNGGAEVEVTENLDTYVKNVGNYVVRFEAHKNANVYSQTRTYTITKCDLAKVELVYNGDTVTWTDTQTNGETVVVKYTIAATEITNNAYTATQKNTEEVKLVVSTDNANYNGYELTLANVYSVTFSYLATHDAETNTAIVKYVFDGQHAASIELPTETGYTFSGWYLLDNETVAESVFDFATTEIKNDITLTGKWTVNTYTVTFKLGNGQDDVTVSVNYGEKIADKIPADPTKAADDYIYTFKYWTLSTDETKAEVNVAEYVVSGDVTFVAEYDQTKNEFTVTLVIKYNDETITTETRVGKLGQTIELPSGIQSKVLKLGKWLYEDETEFDGKITKTATVTATYEIILEKGDVNGDGKVNLDDVVLFRMYLVGGYAMDVVADENIYTAITAEGAASKTMFFKYSANMDDDANLDIRDVATIRMNVVATTEGGEEQTQTTQSAARMEVVSEAVQYAVLPTNKFVA